MQLSKKFFSKKKTWHKPEGSCAKSITNQPANSFQLIPRFLRNLGQVSTVQDLVLS